MTWSSYGATVGDALLVALTVRSRAASLGHTVTAVDSAPSLLEAARAAGSGHDHRLADAADLPFADGAFDRVVAYNMLMDVPDADAVLGEAARVLEARTPGTG